MRHFNRIGGNIAVAVATMMAVACTTTAVQSVGTRLAVQYGVAKYAERFPEAERPARMVRVQALTVELRKLIADDAETSIPVLTRFIADHIATANLAPPERMLAEQLVAAVAVEVAKRLAEGTLDAEGRVVVLEALTWIDQAAAYWIPSVES
jgi:hypothetical protein